MPQPNPYVKTTNFVDKPFDQDRRPDLDREFDNIQTTTAEVRANLALIQRDDGKLVNGVVGFDQLAEDALNHLSGGVLASTQALVDQATAAKDAALVAQGATEAAQAAAETAQAGSITAMNTAAAHVDTANAAVVAAEAARDAAANTAMYIGLPARTGDDIGRGVVVGQDGNSWALGGTAGALNAGILPEDVATHAQVDTKIANGVNSPVPAQAIIQALTGMRPDGWGPQDCDAPVCSILADRILPHSMNYGDCGVAYSDTSYSAGYEPFILFNGSTTGAFFATSLTPIGTSFGYKHHAPRKTNGITLTSFDSTVRVNDLTAFRIVIDGVLVATFTGQVWARKETKTFSYPETLGSDIRIIVDAFSGTSGSNSVALQAMAVLYADVSAGQVLIPAGLQVSYADNGKVKVSKVLAAPLTVDPSVETDGAKHISVILAADGTIESVEFSDVLPKIGTKQDGVDAMPAAASNVIAGWFTLAASSEVSGYQAFNAFDKNGSTEWQTVGTSGNIVLTGAKSRKVVGFAFKGRIEGGSVAYAPHTIRVNDGSTDLVNATGLTWASTSEIKFFPIAPTDITNLTIFIAGNSNPCALAEVTIFFAGDLYTPAAVIHLDSSGTPIRRVCLGNVIVSGGKVVAVNCYALGSHVRLPANNGNVVTAATHSINNPFGDDRACVDAEYLDALIWYSHAEERGWDNGTPGRKRTSLTSSAYTWKYRGMVEQNEAGTSLTPKVRIIFKRSY